MTRPKSPLVTYLKERNLTLAIVSENTGLLYTALAAASGGFRRLSEANWRKVDEFVARHTGEHGARVPRPELIHLRGPAAAGRALAAK